MSKLLRSTDFIMGLWPKRAGHAAYRRGLQERIQEFALGGVHSPLHIPLEVRFPLKPVRERCKLPSRVRGGSPAENEFGAL